MSPNDEKDDWDEAVYVPVLQMLQRVLPQYDVQLSDARQIVVREAVSSPPVLERDISLLLAQLAEAQYRARRVEALISRLADDLSRALQPEPVQADQPFPILRPAAFLSAYGADALSRDGVGDCVAVLMRKRDGAPPQVLTQGMAAQANLTEDALWTAAQRNLRALASTLVLQEYDYGVMSIEVENHDWLGGSLMLSPTVLRQALERLNIQSALVCAPSQISVDLVDARAPDALARMKKWMAERLSEDRQLSELVFEFDRSSGRLQPRYASRGGRLIGPVQGD